MKLTWLGHSGFRLEIGDQILLIDPWMTGNPTFDEKDRAAAIAGATAILITHGHEDHAYDAAAVSRELSIPVAGVYDLMNHWKTAEKIETIAFHRGGTIMLGDVAVTMVAASHSSSITGEAGPIYMGAPAGFMIAQDGRTVYVSGDTDVMADMAVFEALHQPEIGILCAGGHFTMDMKRAAYAAKTFFNFKTVIPHHYKTFPMLEQSAEALIAALPDVDVIEPEVMVPITL